MKCRYKVINSVKLAGQNVKLKFAIPNGGGGGGGGGQKQPQN